MEFREEKHTKFSETIHGVPCEILHGIFTPRREKHTKTPWSVHVNFPECFCIMEFHWVAYNTVTSILQDRQSRY